MTKLGSIDILPQYLCPGLDAWERESMNPNETGRTMFNSPEDMNAFIEAIGNGSSKEVRFPAIDASVFREVDSDELDENGNKVLVLE